MLRTATAISLALLLTAQPALAQDAGQVQGTASAPAAAAPAAAPAHQMSFAEKLAIAAGVIGAGVLAVKALKGSGQGSSAPAGSGAASLPPQAAPQPAVQ